MSMRALDERLMRMALGAARRGRPSPNPHVGALVARGDEVIAIGHHERAGLAHAEVVALAKAGERARGATLYVTFEPCNHVGRTPPCTDTRPTPETCESCGAISVSARSLKSRSVAVFERSVSVRIGVSAGLTLA